MVVSNWSYFVHFRVRRHFVRVFAALEGGGGSDDISSFFSHVLSGLCTTFTAYWPKIDKCCFLKT